jgi:RNA polymerase sigma-70 factor (ECF subfamily)
VCGATLLVTTACLATQLVDGVLMADVQTSLEQEIQAAWTAGRLEEAATRTMKGYGNEILGFLNARLGSETEGREVFSIFAEDFWTGLSNFNWRCSMRVWAYTLARNAANRYAKHPLRRAERNFALSPQDQHLSELMASVRSVTQLYRRTETKDRFQALREQLDPEDQMLLILRVDRGMAFRDLAFAMTGDLELDDVALEREVARLRKAFERIKTELRRMATEQGLMGSED